VSTYRVPRNPEARRDLLYSFTGQRVTLIQRVPGAGTLAERTGRIIVVAVADHGTTSDFVVIDIDGPGYHPRAYSIAQIIRIVKIGEESTDG
jgi:hypothetical protein